ncbi:MAG: hypothetical protein ACKO32_08230 [Planctomycetia bacterium]
MKPLLPLLLACCAPTALAQVQTAWIRDYNSPVSQADWGHRAASDSAGNIIVVGRSFNPTSGTPPAPPTDDMITVKYDVAGNLLWEQRFDYIGGNDNGRDVLVAPDGSVYAIAYCSGYVGANYVTDMITVKYSSGGTLLWSRSYDGPGASADLVRRARFDSAGNIVLVGYSYSAAGDSDGALVCYDPAGNLLWTRLVNGSANLNDAFYDIGFAADGTIRAVGHVNSGGEQALAVASFDAGGNLLWLRENNGPVAGVEYLLSAAVTASGDSYASGNTLGGGSGQDIAVLKYDAAGNFQWRRTISGSGNATDNGLELAADASGNAYVCGYVRQASGGDDMLLAKYDGAGTQLWQRNWDSGALLDDQAWSVELDALSRVTLGGWRVASTGTVTNRDYALVQYEGDGTLRWSHIVSSPGVEDDRLYDLHTTAQGLFVLTGQMHAATQVNGDAGTALVIPQARSFCFGNGSLGNCPCANNSSDAGRGCLNSVSLSAQLSDGGVASLSNDTLVFTSSGEPGTALSIFLQGTAQLANPAPFGDGLRCTGGTLKRLYVKAAVNGVARAPLAGDASVSAQSSALGDPLTAGARRYVQVYYRDANANFCPAPQGSTFNISSGLILDWMP